MLLINRILLRRFARIRYNKVMRVLLIEDNLLTARGLEFLLEREGFTVEVATDTTSALGETMARHFDLILLDVTLPDGDGFQLAHEIKKRTSETPIIFLTARDDEDSVARGLNLGADDYITKPFRNRELIAHIRAVLRRHGQVEEKLKCGNLELNIKTQSLKCNKREIDLSALEYKITYLLMINAGQIVKRERLLDEIWEASKNVVNDNTLTVYIKRIREKLMDENLIKTVKGVGYKLEV